MQLPDDLRTRLASQYEYAATHMRDAEDPRQKLWFYTVFYGESTRVMNMHWDAQLALIHGITQLTFGVIDQRITALAKGQEPNISLPANFMDALTDAADDLTAYVRDNGSDEELLRILSRLYELSYVSTGNGFYLYSSDAGPTI